MHPCRIDLEGQDVRDFYDRIGKRRKAELSLQKSEEKYRLPAETAREIIMVPLPSFVYPHKFPEIPAGE